MMNSLEIAATMFGCVLLSTLAAMVLARRLPEHHLSGESKDVVKLGLGVVGTLTALVIGLLVSDAKGTFDTQSTSIKNAAAHLAMIDHFLGHYGPEANASRKDLQVLAQSIQDQLWPRGTEASNDFSGGPSRHAGDALFASISQLAPTNDTQRLLKDRALDSLISLGEIRQQLVVTAQRSTPAALLIVLAVWQAVLFAGFGLLSPRNFTAVAVLVVCMISVSGAIFLVMELDRPFAGIIRVSDAPLHSVMAHLGE